MLSAQRERIGGDAVEFSVTAATCESLREWIVYSSVSWPSPRAGGSWHTGAGAAGAASRRTRAPAGLEKSHVSQILKTRGSRAHSAAPKNGPLLARARPADNTQ